MAIRPATPGTVVVGIATILLIIVSVSAPLWGAIYFLKATVGGEEIRLGCWGYCSANGCTKTTLGYSLDLQKLFDLNGVDGIDLTKDIPNTLVKWLTYVLVLHPVAGAFALASTILGLLAHIRGFQGTCFTTCMASFGATIALIAFAFDLGLFIVAKKRIESSAVGGTAEFGSAIWLTLVAAVLLLTSSCFFGCGKCIVRERRSQEKIIPVPDVEYGAKMRNAAFENKSGLDNGGYKHNKDGSLPVFADRYGEAIPLNSMQRDTDDDWDDTSAHQHQQPRYPGGYVAAGGPRDDGSMVSGVGEGYGRRNDAPVGGHGGLAPSSASVYTAGGAGIGAGGGAAAMLAANARADRGMPQRSASQTTEPFTGMNGSPARQLSPPLAGNSPHRTQYPDYPIAGTSQMPQPQPYSDPYSQSQQPYDYSSQSQGYSTQPQYDGYGAQASSSHPAPFANAPAANQYASEKSLSSYHTPDNMTPSASVGSVPQQTHFVQNRSASPPQSVQAPSYTTHQPFDQHQPWHSGQQGYDQQQYGYGGGQQRY